MGDKKVSLVNNGGRVAFDSADGARHAVDHGQTFEVDEQTAQTLMSTDPMITLASDQGPAMSAPAANNPVLLGHSSQGASLDMGDLDSMQVKDLREKAKEYGLNSEGSKPEVLDRLKSYKAGFEAAGGGMGMGSSDPGHNPTNWANRSPSPGASLPTNPGAPDFDSTESEPGAPPPPEGDSNEGHGQAQGSVFPPGAHVSDEQAKAETGSIKLEDLGKGGVVNDGD